MAGLSVTKVANPDIFRGRARHFFHFVDESQEHKTLRIVS
jgi:hypothetical protein